MIASGEIVPQGVEEAVAAANASSDAFFGKGEGEESLPEGTDVEPQEGEQLQEQPRPDWLDDSECSRESGEEPGQEEDGGESGEEPG